jgi:hypothetical protein
MPKPAGIPEISAVKSSGSNRQQLQSGQDGKNERNYSL